MVIHPAQIQVDNELRKNVMTEFSRKEVDYDFELPQKVLASYCADRSIPCLDLLPAFRAAGEHTDLYLLRDRHYNANGNELAARKIAEFLRAYVSADGAPRENAPVPPR
jgi:hypothetical protein